MAQAASKTCEICMSRPGHNYCEQCDQLFCDGCKISHLRTKMAKKHTFVSSLNINPQVKQFCKEHDENFIYYCKECNMPICKICVIKKHKLHDFAEIKESTDGIRDEIKRVIDMQIGNLQSKISDIKQGSNRYQADVNRVILSIREEGKHLKEQIDMNVASLVNSVKQKETKNLETLRSIENEIKTALNKTKEQQKIYQDTQGMKDTTKLIQQLKQINSQIGLIDEKPILAMPFVKYSGKKVPGSEIKNLFGDLTFGETVKREETSKPQMNVRETVKREESPKLQLNVRETVKREETPKPQMNIRETVKREETSKPQMNVRETVKREESPKLQLNVRETVKREETPKPQMNVRETVIREETPKPKRNVIVKPAAKEYRYRCTDCKSEIISEESPL